MKWSKEPPTVPDGWYLVREQRDIPGGAMCWSVPHDGPHSLFLYRGDQLLKFVDGTAEREFRELHGHAGMFTTMSPTFEWCGPIPLPEEPS